MRTWLAAFIALGALAQAPGALAQAQNYSEMSPPAPPAQAYAPATEPRVATLPSPYVRKLAFLRNKLLFTKARDGGRLTPDHAQALQRELDALNRDAAGQRN
jgi:hypothetical protein